MKAVAGLSIANRRGEFLGLEFVLQRGQQFVHRAIHHIRQLVQREVDAVVGDAALREIVGADAFGAIAAAHLQLARLRLRAGLLFLFRGQQS